MSELDELEWLFVARSRDWPTERGTEDPASDSIQGCVKWLGFPGRGYRCAHERCLLFLAVKRDFYLEWFGGEETHLVEVQGSAIYFALNEVVLAELALNNSSQVVGQFGDHGRDDLVLALVQYGSAADQAKKRGPEEALHGVWCDA